MTRLSSSIGDDGNKRVMDGPTTTIGVRIVSLDELRFLVSQPSLLSSLEPCGATQRYVDGISRSLIPFILLRFLNTDRGSIGGIR